MSYKKFTTFFLIVLMAIISSVVFAQDDDDGEMMMDETVIEYEAPGLMPEGIEYDAERGVFLIGSLTQGNISTVTMDGEIETFIEDEDLQSSIGIHIDAETNRLLVANSNSSERSIAQLAAYDLETGERIFLADLNPIYESESYFANDVTSDADGNAYVTNSFAPVVYQVTPEGEASVFIEDERFSVQGFGLNGIDYHPDGYLLVAVAGSGSVFKVPVDAPEDITQVELPTTVGIDGMVITPSMQVVAIGRLADPQTGDNIQAVTVLTSENDWESAEVSEVIATDGNATTVVMVDGVAYYVKAYFSNPSMEVYDIVGVTPETVTMMMDDDSMDDMEEDSEEDASDD